MHPAVTRIAILMILSLLCGAASAQGDAARAKRWEFSLQLPDVQGKNYSFEGGSSARTSNTLGFGVGFAYNLSNHLNLGMDFNWYSMDFDATIQPGAGSGQAAFTTRGTADVSSVMFNATYHFLSGPVTPYVLGGIGGTFVDSNIQTGPAVPVCCWTGNYPCSPLSTSEPRELFEPTGLILPNRPIPLFSPVRFTGTGPSKPASMAPGGKVCGCRLWTHFSGRRMSLPPATLISCRKNPKAGKPVTA